MKITGVAFTLYPVTDLPRARSFYEGVLGLTAARSFGNETSGCVEYHLGRHRLVIDTGTARPASSGGGSAALDLDDFESALSSLRHRGVPFVLEPASPLGRVVSLADPEGNTLCLHDRQSDLSGPAIVHQ